MLDFIKEKKAYYYELLQHLIEIGASERARNNAHQRFIAIRELYEELTPSKVKAKEKAPWVDGYLQWKADKKEYTTVSKDKIYESWQSVKGSLGPNACDEELIRPLTKKEDKAVSWLSELLIRYQDK